MSKKIAMHKHRRKTFEKFYTVFMTVKRKRAMCFLQMIHLPIVVSMFSLIFSKMLRGGDLPLKYLHI